MNDQNANSTPVIGATVLGYPRIGRRRELKHVLESYWAGSKTIADVDAVSELVRRGALRTMQDAGLDSVPVNTFSWYDHVLDTCVLAGAVPARFGAVADTASDRADRVAGFDAATYFAMARGTQALQPLEMTKWFDTNYHYLVPEIAPTTTFELHADKPLAEYAEATELGVHARPVVVGPWTFLELAKAEAGSPDTFEPKDRLDDLVEIYVQLIGELFDAGVEWVQIDEPAVVTGLDDDDVEAVRRTYERLGRVERRPQILVSTYFADPVEALPALAATPVEAIGVDTVRGPDLARLASVPDLATKTVVLGAVDGRNVWRADVRALIAEIVPFLAVADTVAVSTSCSLLHVPHDVDDEDDLDPQLRKRLAFADQKLVEVVEVQRAVANGLDHAGPGLAASDEALRSTVPGRHNPVLQERIAGVSDADRRRVPQSERAAGQAERLRLPTLPTTTIGSYPQTSELRRARSERRRGTMDERTYRATMSAEIDAVIELQDRVGLDVLVHGEPERNDMVQYFAEQLDGYAGTQHGWVQSYGTRCVRPPILFGDVSRPTAMTVEWARHAQGRTAKPVKGMLTGPVTMLAWSFVRDDQPYAVTADQVALALRDEIADLEDAGLAIIQVDEPALRELLPLRTSAQPEYLAWSVAAFGLATSGVDPSTQIHTHLCYSEFTEVIDAIDGLDADVTSLEAARSHMELLDGIAEHGFTGALGPGVYDIHSPRVPDRREIESLLSAALKSVPAHKLWVNPDCGLKTRSYTEVEPTLENLVAATHRIRDELGAD